MEAFDFGARKDFLGEGISWRLHEGGNADRNSPFPRNVAG
jgi:hypothetical protein